MKLQNKVCLITGAASGLGFATAALFASEGARLCLVDWNADGLKAIGDILSPRDGRRSLILTGDVSAPAFVESTVAEVIDWFGEIDVLLNGAGVDPVAASTIAETSVPDWDRIMDINLRAAFMLCRLCLPLMVKKGGGVVINIGSTAGVKPTIGQAAYSVSKAGIIALTKSIALEYAGSGIRANCICPGFLEKPMTDRLRDLTPEQLQNRSRHVRSRVPMAREGTYQEAGRAALFLATEESSYITGTVLALDGGWLAT